jgi:hypothetical protein
LAGAVDAGSNGVGDFAWAIVERCGQAFDRHVVESIELDDRKQLVC